jgi:multiple sugar transport system permease protein
MAYLSLYKNRTRTREKSNPQKRKLFKRLKFNITAWILLLPSLFCFLVFSWQPLLSGLILSFFKTKGYEAVEFIGFDNYIAVISNSEFKRALVNTFFYTLWSLIIGYLIPVIVAILLNEMVHFKTFFKLSFYFPAMIPSMAAALLWYFMFNPGDGGILNSLLSIVGLPKSEWLQNSNLTIILIVITMTWRGFGSTMLMYLAGLQSLNQELYEAASLDGAGLFRRIRYITIPHLSGIMGLMFIMQIISTFQTMQEPLVMTSGGPNNASITLMLESYYQAFNYFNAGRSMAIGGITFVILSGMTVIYMLYNARTEQDAS